MTLVTIEERPLETIRQQRDYDLAMVRACWGFLQQDIAWSQEIRNALLECFLLHAYVLLDGYAHSDEVFGFCDAVNRYLLRANTGTAERTKAQWNLSAIAEACEGCATAEKN